MAPLRWPVVLSFALIAACGQGLTSPSPVATTCAPSAASARLARPFFGRPFTGNFPTGNLFDHDKPVVFDDNNGRLVSMCGNSYPLDGQTDGHDGYDWRMPEGTPILAVANGEVLVAGSSTPAFCPPLGRTLQALVVALRHVDANGDVFFSIYGHLSRVDVAVGQRIDDGSVIGLSGNTGCSGTPHLHFGAMRPAASGLNVVVDPYGWHASASDPWEADPRGAQSVWLWRDGEAPSLR